MNKNKKTGNYKVMKSRSSQSTQETKTASSTPSFPRNLIENDDMIANLVVAVSVSTLSCQPNSFDSQLINSIQRNIPLPLHYEPQQHPHPHHNSKNEHMIDAVVSISDSSSELDGLSLTDSELVDFLDERKVLTPNNTVGLSSFSPPATIVLNPSSYSSYLHEIEQDDDMDIDYY